MPDIAHPDSTPRNVSLMIALHLAEGDKVSAEHALVELIAWLAFDKPTHSEVREPPVRVLVVDDCVDAAHVECVLFSHLGHTAVPAHSGREAVVMTGVFNPDVVLLDLDLHRMDGCEVARLIRARRRCAYIVGVSSWTEHTNKSRALAAGCDTFLAKPVDLSKIRALLNNLGPR